GARGGRRRRPPPAVEARPRSLLLGTDWDAVIADGPEVEDADAGVTVGAPVATAEPRRAVAGPPPAHRRRVPLRSAAAVGAVATVAAAGLLLLAPWSSPAADDAPAAASTPPTPSTRPQPPSTTAPTTTRPLPTVRSDCNSPASVLIADVDGDGCPDALRYADGILEGAGTRWALGQAGDQVAVGDWSCRGARTVVLLRPSTGDVYRFDGWAVGTVESVTAVRVATVAGGQAVRAADVDRDGCHELVVERGELPPQVVRMPRLQP
ncbi:MAG: eukaryotic-like serine/threonine-protein kinase, partial [Actinomycetota bacterium]|nr:eukaryotic-like serine/threonine-protein kinase [Actinomycetota bacterium]